MKTSNQELERLVAVYQGYRRDPQKMSQWDLSNAGNRMILQERDQAFSRILWRQNFLPLDGKVVLDIGCGEGDNLAGLVTMGASAANLYGVDLLPDRVETAKRNHPQLHFDCQNAEHLPYPDQAFDLVMLFTVFSSIFDPGMRSGIAQEAARVLKAGGGILWYDLRYNNPRNPHVRKVSRRDLQRLFPGFSFSGETVTLLPPLARRLGNAAPVLYPLLAQLRLLRTHYAGMLRRKPAC